MGGLLALLLMAPGVSLCVIFWLIRSATTHQRNERRALREAALIADVEQKANDWMKSKRKDTTA
jgi:hypothetical protein